MNGAAATAPCHSETTNHDMTIRLSRIRKCCLHMETEHRWSLYVQWLGKWWGRRPFFQDYWSEYHNGWTVARHIWIGPFMMAWFKHLTPGEKHELRERQREADAPADGKPDSQEENTLLDHP